MSVRGDRSDCRPGIPVPGKGAADPRVVFTAFPHADGALDGGWWPHTTHLADELPALLDMVQARFGEVGRVSLSASIWDATPPEITTGDRIVAVAWFRALDAHTIRLLGAGFGHLNLLVISPDTIADNAAAALALVAGRHSIAALHAILAAAPPARPVPAPEAAGAADPPPTFPGVAGDRR
jgi:hypothetical protein